MCDTLTKFLTTQLTLSWAGALNKLQWYLFATLLYTEGINDQCDPRDLPRHLEDCQNTNPQI